MQALLSTLSTTICVCKTPLELCDWPTAGVALELGDLEGDGMPKAEVERLLSRAETDAQRLLDDYEAVRQRLKGGIKHEYDAMRRGESELLRFLDQALACVRVFARLEPERPTRLPNLDITTMRLSRSS